ncbi:acyl-CoA dehydrogenase family protein [Sandaracinobacteroides saxicola]|uniref:Acyl-CoA dehydrogenase family protein n=1 Tax=Sandaracinobacteroides saxicola TaxID=2759707 RepID=A0A7G5IFG3_9SPHN|nr:acyl-CoA dehydrogenase family protein [Sandaracinobacteroides saxicola]QMW22105.1 acyl-CoA dehydrogenase family protein [Sandaracinobacteroides saxicola]
MDFNFTETQTMLRDSLSRWLADTYTFDARQKMLSRPEGRDPGIWRALATELGILGAPFSEDRGGFGGGALDSMVVMEELGKAIAVEPYVQTVVIGGTALERAGGAHADALIPAIIAGECIIAFAYAEPQGRYELANLTTTAKADGSGWTLNGHKSVVIAAPYATHYLVTARTGGSRREASGVSLFLVDAQDKGIIRRDYPTVDGFMASELFFENANVGPQALLGYEGQALPLIEELVDRATAAVCAEASGVMRVMHAMTLDYARQRKQFGTPIAKFQVLQHRMVDMFLEVEQAVSMTLMATLKLDEPAADRMAAVSAAKSKIAKGARFTGQSAVQIHGGIGITTELAVGHYFKRATMIESQFGDADHHLRRFERLTLA